MAMLCISRNRRTPPPPDMVHFLSIQGGLAINPRDPCRWLRCRWLWSAGSRSSRALRALERPRWPRASCWPGAPSARLVVVNLDGTGCPPVPFGVSRRGDAFVRCQRSFPFDFSGPGRGGGSFCALPSLISFLRGMEAFVPCHRSFPFDFSGPGRGGELLCLAMAHFLSFGDLGRGGSF